MDLLQKYGYTPSEEEVAARIQAVAANLEGLGTPEVLKRCFSLMDLTTLKSDDTGFITALSDMDGVESAVLVSYNGDYME